MEIKRKSRLYPLSSIILLTFILNVGHSLLHGQERPQEEVTVIAVEVPVRVFYKGRFVKDLTKDDFEIYDNGIKQDITAFEVISRKIARPQDKPEQARKIPPRTRLFILIFNIYDYNDVVGEAIDYFFKNVFRSGDWILILTEDSLLNIEIGKDLSEMILDLKQTLRRYKKISTREIRKNYHRLSLEGDTLLSRLRDNPSTAQYKWGHDILMFYDNYIRIWEEYKGKFINPHTDLYRSIAKRVKQIEGEKWALCFQQRELFPNLKREGPLSREIRKWVEEGRGGLMSRMIQLKQQELQRSLNYSITFPTETLKNLFMEANITFHLILLKPLRDLPSENFVFKEVAQDYEDCFKQISFSTGGYSNFSNKVTQALKEATEVEDYHYLLVYQPKEEIRTKKREIRVKVKREGVKAVHSKRFVKKGTPPIMIGDFNVGHKSIEFSLVNYKMTQVKKKLSGIVDVRITIFDASSNKVFDEGRIMNLFDKQSHVSLDFNWLKSGSYFIIIQADDKISKEIDVFSKRVDL